MATKSELLQIEKNIEDAWKLGLSTEIPTVDFFVSASNDVLVTPRVEIWCNGLVAQETLSQAWGSKEYLRFSCDLSVVIVTEYTQGGDRDGHNKLLGDIRASMLLNSDLDFDTLLPDHQIRDMRLTMSDRSAEGETIRTEMTYKIIVDVDTPS